MAMNMVMKHLTALSVLTLSLFAHSAPLFDQTLTIDQESRRVLIFGPANPTEKLPVVLALHGCLQDANQFARSTRLAAWAEAGHGYAIFPEQRRSVQPLGCWTWYDTSSWPEDRREVDWLAKALRQTLKQLPKMDAERVFVAGLSAGAAMSANLLACHPHLFAGGLVHSGLAAGIAQNSSEAQRVMRQGSSLTAQKSAKRAALCANDVPSRQGLPRLWIVHGTSDSTVAPINAEFTFAQWPEIVNTWLNLGGAAEKPWRECDRTQAKRGRGQSAPAERSVTLRGLTLQGARSCLMEMLLIDGLSHAWSGGERQAFSDPQGPSATDWLIEKINETK